MLLVFSLALFSLFILFSMGLESLDYSVNHKKGKEEEEEEVLGARGVGHTADTDTTRVRHRPVRECNKAGGKEGGMLAVCCSTKRKEEDGGGWRRRMKRRECEVSKGALERKTCQLPISLGINVRAVRSTARSSSSSS